MQQFNKSVRVTKINQDNAFCRKKKLEILANTVHIIRFFLFCVSVEKTKWKTCKPEAREAALSQITLISV